MKTFKIVCDCPQMHLLVELSARKTNLLDLNTSGNLQTRFTNTGFREQLNSYDGDKDFNKLFTLILFTNPPLRQDMTQGQFLSGV